MRIIQIGNYPEDENIIKGGIQSSLFGLVSELVRKNHFVQVISLPDIYCKQDHSKERTNLRINYLSNKFGFNILAAFRFFHISRQIKAFKPDLCHLHSADLLVFLLYIYCRLYKIPSVITIHGLAYIEKRNTFQKKKSLKNFLKFVFESLFEFILLNLLDKVIVDTKYVANSFINLKKSIYFFRLPEIYIIPQGINERFFHLADNFERERILAVGSMSVRKGHLLLIKAVEKIIPDYPNLKLDIIGNKSNPLYYEKLKNYISTRGLDRNINIHNGLTLDDLTKYYVSCNIFALHSEEESQGIVFCEAMACGKPIVATNAGGIPDVVVDGQGGFLTSFSDTGAFTESIKKILSNDALRRQFSAFNKNHSLQYSWTKIADQILNVYNETLAKKSSPSQSGLKY